MKYSEITASDLDDADDGDREAEPDHQRIHAEGEVVVALCRDRHLLEVRLHSLLGPAQALVQSLQDLSPVEGSHRRPATQLQQDALGDSPLALRVAVEFGGEVFGRDVPGVHEPKCVREVIHPVLAGRLERKGLVADQTSDIRDVVGVDKNEGKGGPTPYLCIIVHQASQQAVCRVTTAEPAEGFDGGQASLASPVRRDDGAKLVDDFAIGDLPIPAAPAERADRPPHVLAIDASVDDHHEGISKVVVRKLCQCAQDRPCLHVVRIRIAGPRKSFELRPQAVFILVKDRARGGGRQRRFLVISSDMRDEVEEVARASREGRIRPACDSIHCPEREESCVLVVTLLPGRRVPVPQRFERGLTAKPLQQVGHPRPDIVRPSARAQESRPRVHAQPVVGATLGLEQLQSFARRDLILAPELVEQHVEPFLYECPC
jgi:hypothetical protein